jgi:hypothetical protein
MPLVNVKLIEGVFTPAQKQETIRRLSDAMVSIEGENMRPVTCGDRRSQKRRLGNWWQSAHHERCEGTGAGKT